MDSLPVEVGQDLIPRETLLGTVKDRFEHGPSWNNIRAIAEHSDLPETREHAAALVAPVRATIAAVLTAQSQDEEDLPDIEESWADVEMAAEAGDPEPSKTYGDIKNLLQTWCQTLFASGEAAGSEDPKPVLIPGAHSKYPVVIGSSTYLEMHPIRSFRLAEAHPTATALALLDVAIRNLALGEVQRAASSQKQKKNRGHENRRASFGALDKKDVNDKDLALWNTKQRQAAIVCLENILDFRDIVYSGQQLTDQMVLEAMLLGVVPVNKDIIETMEQILNQHSPLGAAKDVVGEDTQRAKQNAVANAAAIGNGAIELGRSVLFGANGAEGSLNVHNGFMGFVDSLGATARKFMIDTGQDFQAHLAEHVAFYAIIAGAVGFLALDAQRRYSPSRVPVDMTAVSWAAQRLDLLKEVVPVEQQVIRLEEEKMDKRYNRSK